MKIIGINPAQGIVRPNDVNPQARKKAVQSEKDSYVPSKKALEVSIAHKAYKATPDVNADRVASLKAQIQAGTYEISPWDIASKMVDEKI